MEKLFRFLRKVSDTSNIAAEYLTICVVLTMACVIVVQVFCRYALNHSLFWSEELGRVLLVWMTFFGASVAYKRGAHMGLDFFVGRLSPRTQRYIIIFTHMLALCFFAMIIWYGFTFCAKLKFQMTTTLGISKQLPFMAVPASACLMFVHALAFIGTPDTSQNFDRAEQ